MKRFTSGKAVAAALGLVVLAAGLASATDITARPAVYTRFKSTPAASADLPMQISTTPNLSTQISGETPVTTVGWRHRGYYGGGYYGYRGGYYGGYRGYGYRPYGYGYGYRGYYGYRPYVAPYVAYRPYCYPSYGYGGGYGYPYAANYGYAGYSGPYYGRPYVGAPWSWGW